MAVTGPEVMRVGQARLTAGLDRLERIDLSAHGAVFGPMPGLTASELIRMTEQVDLRGRGGAAFPVARKLRAVLASSRRRHGKAIVVVNATEGEPGSEKDKMLLRRSPHLVLGGAMLAARALRARQVIVGVAGDGQHARSVRAAVEADPELRRWARVVSVPDRFVSGESGALVNAINGKAALPPGRKTRASDSGVGGQPTLLSNAETFAQLAVLAMLGADGYASTGAAAEPGTVMLSVGGSAARPAVVETPTGVPLGQILDICQAGSAEGVLVGGYHGRWLSPETAYQVPVSRAGLAAAGGTLGAGIVLPLGRPTCALGEVARVAGYLAKESSGQCGPCMLGLPAIARSLAALAQGSGGADALDTARRAAAAVRGRGACAHPDGVFSFVVSALDVFADDLAAHLFRGTCGRPVLGLLPLSRADDEARLTVDWTRCRGHGLCGHVVPELIQLDGQGYPELLDMPVPPWLTRQARQAVEMCPALALRLTRAPAPPLASAGPPRSPAVKAARRPAVASVSAQGRAKVHEGLVVSEAWIRELGDGAPVSGTG
jgi:NADH:ubiquinone oxidoreductase subunit F (NADH-binding)/ferredoxin